MKFDKLANLYLEAVAGSPISSHNQDMNNKVYVLLGGFEYEGQTLLGVYSTRKQAESALKNMAKANRGRIGYDTTDIEEVVINAPAQGR